MERITNEDWRDLWNLSKPSLIATALAVIAACAMDYGYARTTLVVVLSVYAFIAWDDFGFDIWIAKRQIRREERERSRHSGNYPQTF